MALRRHRIHLPALQGKNRRAAILQGTARRCEPALAALGLCFIYAVLASRFDLKLLFEDSILTGGDSASWFQVLKTMKEDFLPRGRFFGFSQDNFFGYMEGQHYFVLPFLAAALAGFAVPLAVALKLVTVAGGFFLPATMYFAARTISRDRMTGLLASSFSLLFLFNESYTIFGANWLSTFAGEFCFSWATAFLPLLVASVLEDERKSRKGILSGLILGLIGLCHFFVFMPAFFIPFFPAFPALIGMLRRKKHRASQEGEQGRLRTARIYATYSTALMVMAFWLLPMAATRMWAQPISMIWHFASAFDFARQTLAWIWLPLGIAFLYASVRLHSGEVTAQGRDARSHAGMHTPHAAVSQALALCAYLLGACLFLFFVAPGLGMPDIRFIPTMLLCCALGAAILTGFLLAPDKSQNRAQADVPLSAKPGIASPSMAGLVALAAKIALCVIACAGAAMMARNSPAWFRWNYSGYESKAEWGVLETMASLYAGDADDGRFLWEKQDQRDNRDFGSERAFENMSLFTGRPTSEGIHYGSSMMARAATYLQSSYSLNPVDPESERIYSEVDPSSWPDRFAFLNASLIVTHSERITSMFASHPSFALDSKTGKFSVFRFRDFPGSYVRILPHDAVSIVREGAGGFRADYYRFFRNSSLYGHPFVSARFADRGLEALTGQDVAHAPGYGEWERKAAAMPPAMPAEVMRHSTSEEKVDDFSIRFRTGSPGMPHLIAVSWAPGWKSEGGERIYPAAPGFMLLYPETENVELRYKRTGWETAGLAMSFLVLPAALVFGFTGKQGRRRLRSWHSRLWTWQLVFSFIVFFSVAAFLVLQTGSGYPALSRDIGTARRLDTGLPAQRTQAEKLVGRWATAENLDRYDNRLVFDAWKIKAMILAREGRQKEADDIVRMLKDRYPRTRVLSSLP
jgi:hypothetical protein